MCWRPGVACCCFEPHDLILQAMDLDWTKGNLAEGLRHYEAGAFFAAHEEWESVWLKADEPEKTFLQAIIQVAAAFHHYRRDNRQGTMLLLQAATRRLEICPEFFGGIAVSELCADIRESLQELQRDASGRQLAPPRIRLFIK